MICHTKAKISQNKNRRLGLSVTKKVIFGVKILYKHKQKKIEGFFIGVKQPRNIEG